MSRITTFLLAFCFFLAPCAPTAAKGQSAATYDVAFVADGAGNYQMASKALRSVVAATHSPVAIETFVWSHGYKKVMPDQTDLAHAYQQGRLLAEQVVSYRQQHPGAKIHLVGHSAGSMVVLAATEYLPPDSLDNIVLLLPSVSTAYDIRPALRSVKGRLEVHCSDQDWFYLGLAMRFVGCADGRHCPASGRVGFQVRVDSAADAALLPRLAQIPWQPCYRQLGHDGGHYGAYQPEYLKALVLPALVHPPR